MAWTFCKKNRSNLVYFGLWSLISDLHPPIGGPHPVLYFPSQIQRNIVQRCARSRLALSKVTHLVQIIPSPPPDQIKRLQRILNHFIWSGSGQKKVVIREGLAQQPPNRGGLGTTHLENFWDSLKMSTLPRRRELYLEKARNVKVVACHANSKSNNQYASTTGT